MKFRLVLGALFAVLISTPALAAKVALPDYQPIADEAYVEDLQQLGHRNGDMPSLRMIELGGCIVERDAGYTLSLMVEAAIAEGIYLEPHDCYRSYGTQASAYDRRCPIEEEEVTEEDPETGETVVVEVKEVRVCKGPPIARAGYSNHGWGRAVDFGNGGRTLTCYDAAFVWLQEHAGSFGWVHPGWAQCGMATREPWHWEWGGVEEALPVPPYEAPPSRGFWSNRIR
jgi:hypothetical protein